MANDTTHTGKIIHGDKVDFKEYKKGLGEFYFENSDKYSDRVFQIEASTGETETYGHVKRRSIQVAVNLKNMGVSSKDVIIICSKSTMDDSIPHISTLFLGATTVALHPTQSIRDWIHCMKIAQPTFIFVEEECVENMEKSIQDIESKPQLIVFGESRKYPTFDYLQRESDEISRFVPISIKDCQETAVILFSSGTTGPPKGMCISHYDIINKTIATLGSGPFNVRVGLMYSTLFWISSVLQLVFCFYSGAIKINPQVFDPQQMLEIIEKYKVTFTFANPILLRQLLTLENAEKFDTSSLIFLTTVGASLSSKENQRLKAIFKNTAITQAYGSSETLTNGTRFNFFTDKKYLHKLDSVGRCTDNCQIKVIDPETNKVLGPMETGEICIKSQFSMSGYHNQDSSSVFDEDGFIKMGDLGYYDEDECFYITGRISETFKYGSNKIPTNYLETILIEHPAVLEAGVFGIPHHTEGFHPAACIVLKTGADATVEDIEKYYNRNVSDWYKLRGGIKVVESLPKTPTFKIQKNKLLNLFQS